MPLNGIIGLSVEKSSSWSYMNLKRETDIKICHQAANEDSGPERRTFPIFWHLERVVSLISRKALATSSNQHFDLLQGNSVLGDVIIKNLSMFMQQNQVAELSLQSLRLLIF